MLTAALMLPGSALSQESSGRAVLTGRVTSRESGSPVQAAVLAIEGTRLVAQTDSSGRYRLLNVPAGPHVLHVRRIGFAPARVPVTIPTSGRLEINVTLARTTLELDDVIVTADASGRAAGELGTASVIDRPAIANQTAASLSGILELVPGIPIAPPGLDGVTQIALRTVPTTTSPASLVQGAPDAADLASFGTLIIVDGVPLSNNANLQSLGARGELPLSTAAGGGIDLRRIPAATLDRVEVIRGLPSARYGDLTQGAVLVHTRASSVAPEMAARYDARTLEVSALGGIDWRDGRQAVTASLDLANTRVSPGATRERTWRTAIQLAHRAAIGRELAGPAQLPRLTFDTRLDYWRLDSDSPEQPEIIPGRASFTHDQGLRLGERLRLALHENATIEWTLALDATRQRAYAQSLRSRPAQPFTDRTSEGRAIGRFVGGDYLSALSLDGDPRMLYSRLEGDLRGTSLGFDRRLRIGAEARREWNTGRGYLFDIEFPPQVSFNGVNGFDRPRRNDTLPAIASSALYADARLARALPRGMSLDVQAGIRVDVLHEGQTWFSGARDLVPQPRINAQLSATPWLRLRGAIGRTAKLPALGDLYPAAQWFDVVNVNRFTPDPAERLAVLTTFVRDPTNDALGFSRARKAELAIEADLGSRGATATLTRFEDRISEGVGLRRDPGFLLRDQYALADTGMGTGQPGRIVDPPIGADSVPIFVERPVNGSRLASSGYELTLRLPELRALRLRLEVSGAFTETRFSTPDRDFGSFQAVSAFEVDSRIDRIPYWEGAVRTGRRDLLTYRLVHHQPSLGLLLTATVQHTLTEWQRDEGGTDTLSFAGYVTRAGETVPVPLAQRTSPEFADLRRSRTGLRIGTRGPPADWLMSLTVAKTLPRDGRLSFYAFNVLDRLGTFGSATRDGRLFSSMRFGVDLTLRLDALLGRTP